MTKDKDFSEFDMGDLKDKTKYAILPPIKIDGKDSVVGVTYDPKNGIVYINHHTRSIPDNKDQDDFKEIAINIQHLPQLHLYISSLI